MALSLALTYDYLRGTLDKLVFFLEFSLICVLYCVCVCVVYKKDLHNRASLSVCCTYFNCFRSVFLAILYRFVCMCICVTINLS